MPRDIEEFLKMAAQRRQQQKQRQQQRPPAPQPAPPVQRRPPITPAIEDDVYAIGDEQDHNLRQQSVRDHVQSHIDTSDIAQHAQKLGHKVGLADDKLEARLQKKFDHDVGHLQIDKRRSAQSETTAVTEKQYAQLASDLMQMLRTPTSIRQAVLISEVLKRPEI